MEVLSDKYGILEEIFVGGNRPEQPPQARGSPPPPAQVAAVAAHLMRLLLTPIVMLANRNGNDAGPQVGNGKHMQGGRPWHAALGHLSCRPFRFTQSHDVYKMLQRSSRLRQPLGYRVEAQSRVIGANQTMYMGP